MRLNTNHPIKHNQINDNKINQIPQSNSLENQEVIVDVKNKTITYKKNNTLERIYIGDIKDNKKNGDGVITYHNGSDLLRFEGKFNNDKAQSGTYYYKTYKLTCEQISGSPVVGSKCTYTPYQDLYLRELSGKYSGDKGNMIDKEVAAIIIIDQKRYNVINVTTKNNIIVHGSLLAEDGQIAYIGEFINNQPIVNNLNLQYCRANITIINEDGTQQSINPRKFAQDEGFYLHDDVVPIVDQNLHVQCYNPQAYNIEEFPIMFEYIKQIKTNELVQLRNTQYNWSVFAKNNIDNGSIIGVYATGISAQDYNDDAYKMAALKNYDGQPLSATAYKYGNILRYVQCATKEPVLHHNKPLGITANLKTITFIIAGKLPITLLIAIKNIKAGEMLCFSYERIFLPNEEFAFFNEWGDIAAKGVMNQSKQIINIQVIKEYSPPQIGQNQIHDIPKFFADYTTHINKLRNYFAYVYYPDFIKRHGLSQYNNIEHLLDKKHMLNCIASHPEFRILYDLHKDLQLLFSANKYQKYLSLTQRKRMLDTMLKGVQYLTNYKKEIILDYEAINQAIIPHIQGMIDIIRLFEDKYNYIAPKIMGQYF